MLAAVLRRISVLSAIAICSSFTSAQNSDSLKIHSLSEGSWSLQFQIGSNFNLQTFDGMFFAKYHHSEQNAFRGGFAISGATGSIDDQYNKNLDLRFVFQYLHYILPQSDIALYGGVGPLFTVEHRVYPFSNFTDKLTRWSLGLQANLGIEWFVKHNISLLAEHTGSLQYQRYVRSDQSSRYVGQSLQLTSGAAKLGVSLYL